MKKLGLLVTFILFLLPYNKIIAQQLKIEKISTIYQEVKKNLLPQKDSNSFLVKGYGFQDMFFKIVIIISGKEVFYRSYADNAYLKTEYMESDGKYHAYTPAFMHSTEIPRPEEFNKWYARKDTQIIRKVLVPTMALFDKGPQKFRFQIVYAYYTSKDNRSRKFLKSNWIYMEFEK